MSGNLQLLAGTLARAKQENRAALITGTTAGFPTVNEGIAAVQAMLNSGADIVEVGLPHSDPVLDGPVIQAAGDIALRGGALGPDAADDVDRGVDLGSAPDNPGIVHQPRNVFCAESRHACDPVPARNKP